MWSSRKNFVYTAVYARDGQHVTRMINGEFGIMPPGTVGYKERLERKLQNLLQRLNKIILCCKIIKVRVPFNAN